MDDLDNLRSAVAWGLDSGVDQDEQTAIAIISWLAYECTTKPTGIGQWAEQALPAVKRSTPGRRSAVLAAAAGSALSRGDFVTSERYAQASVAEGYPPDDPSPAAAASSLAVVLMYSGRKEDTTRCLLDAALAPLRFPYISATGPGLAVRVANLSRARETLGDTLYEQAHTEGAAMTRQEALAFVLHHL